MVEDSSSKKKTSGGNFVHWARPKWIRMYNYNYEFGESYYRPQVRYLSTSKVASELNYSSSYSSSYGHDSKSSYQSRRRGVSPPKAASFIERWHAEPFYGSGFISRRSSSESRASSQSQQARAMSEYRASSRAESQARAESQYRSTREESQTRAESQYRSTRAESQARESSVYRSTRAESAERESSEMRASSEMRSRRAQSALQSARYDESSNYASNSLLNQINQVRATSAALQEESAGVQERLRQRRARSLEALRRAELDQAYYQAANDDCLMRSTALPDWEAADQRRRSRREQSVLSDIESRYTREGSAMSRMEDSSSDTFNLEYPRHHLVCSEKCPLFNNPDHHRRFVMGNKFTDAAALGGFDVLFSPTTFSKTRTLLQRLSEERDVDSIVYESSSTTARESSMDRNSRSRSRYTYNTIY